MPFSSPHAALGTLRKNWAAAVVVVLVLVASATANWAYATRVSDQLSSLRGGLCKIVARSNATGVENKHALLSTAARAERRALLDAASGRTALAQADQDAAKLDRKFAGEIQPISLPGCQVR